MPDLWQWSEEGWGSSCCASIELAVGGRGFQYLLEESVRSKPQANLLLFR